jgi:UDP-N-acetylmuramate: L-alanyl-gamma-D-glutamyl-meso-diaminopimelate ligase
VHKSPTHIIYDDFAHHPTAIKATTQALLKKHHNKKIGAIIELASNTMSSGYHDQNLLDAPVGLHEIFWIDPNNVLKTEKAFPTIEIATKELKKIIMALDIVVIMTNKNSKLIKDSLLEAFDA